MQGNIILSALMPSLYASRLSVLHTNYERFTFACVCVLRTLSRSTLYFLSTHCAVRMRSQQFCAHYKFQSRSARDEAHARVRTRLRSYHLCVLRVADLARCRRRANAKSQHTNTHTHQTWELRQRRSRIHHTESEESTQRTHVLVSLLLRVVLVATTTMTTTTCVNDRRPSSDTFRPHRDVSLARVRCHSALRATNTLCSQVALL